MRILFFIDSINKGGAERVLTNLANNFSLNNDVTILTLLDKNIEYTINDTVTFKCLKIKEGKKNIFQKAYYTLKNLKNVAKVFRNKYDVVISFLPRSSFYAALGAKITNTKLIISERNDPSSIYTSNLKKIIFSKIYSLADGFVFQTNDAKNFFCDKIQKKSLIIPNPVSEIFYDYKNPIKRKKNIVSIGRLEEQKNQKLLIEAFKEFKKNNSGYKLIIYGDGPLRVKLESLINEFNLENDVLLPGVVSNISEHIYDAAAFVLTSFYEGMPNALMEALTLGVPSISSDCPCGGPKELIDDGENGYLFKNNDKDELLSCLEKIIDKDISEKFSKNSRKKMLSYKPNIINEKCENYVKEIVGELK